MLQDLASTGQLPSPLALTGERTVPGAAHEEYWYARHLVAYDDARARWPAPTCVVDAGSGEGYGADAFRRSGARSVVGIEYDELVARHCHARYPGIRTVRGNLVSLPVRTGVVDLLVSLQVIEHLWDLTAFLRDVERVLAPCGVAVLTTPNRLTFSPGLAPGEQPTNPFHVEEFDAAQLDWLLKSVGLSATMCGVSHGSRIRAWEEAHGTSLVAAQISASAVVEGTSAPGRGDARAYLPPHELWTFVASVTVDDFDIGPFTDDCQDLVAFATRG